MLLFLLAVLSVDSVRTHAVEVAPGETLHVVEAGAGTPIVLLPGVIGGAYSYRQLLRELVAEGYRVIVVEPLGLGESSRPRKADYSLDAQAARVAQVLDQLEVRRAPLRPRLARVAAPVRLLLGAHPHPGATEPKEVAVLRATVRNFAVDSVAGAGMFIQEEQPGAVCRAVRALMVEDEVARAGESGRATLPSTQSQGYTSAPSGRSAVR